jgi:hypothetical protein
LLPLFVYSQAQTKITFLVNVAWETMTSNLSIFDETLFPRVGPG